MRYFIEQAPDRFYNADELRAARTRAKKLTKSYDLVYIIAERFNAERRDYEKIGAYCYADGQMVGTEGEVF